MKNEKAGSRRVISYDWNLDDYSGGRDSCCSRIGVTDTSVEVLYSMNEPIISPWAVYFIMRLDVIRDLMVGALAFTVFVGMASPIVCALFELDTNDVKEFVKRNIKLFVGICAALGLCLSLLPSSKEATMIYTASKITPQTIQDVGETTDKAIERVLEKIIKLSGEDDKQ